MSPYNYCKDNPVSFFDFEGGDVTPAQYLSYFLNDAVSLYRQARDQGLSVKGAITLVSQVAYESAYGTNTGSLRDNNPFSLMRASGGWIHYDTYQQGLTSFFSNLRKNWPGALPLLHGSDFTSDEIDKVYNDGKYLGQGKPYDAKHVDNPSFDYGLQIMKTDNTLPGRFIRALDIGIKNNNKIIETEGSNLMSALSEAGAALSHGDLKAIEAAQKVVNGVLQKIKKANDQNQLFKQIKTEIEAL
ncbi:hypothetical protein BH09BAC6_BH09BAC6_31550 [soil metagenome]